MARTASIKRLSVFLLPMLLTYSFLVTTNYAIEPATISSYGMVGSGQTSEYLKGVWVSDTAWNTYGSYFEEPQIDMTKDAGGKLLCLAINKPAWDDNDSSNVLGIPFRDYLAQLVDWFEPMKTVFSLHRDSSMAAQIGRPAGEWLAYEKNTVVTTEPWRQAWIDWGSAIVTYCQPWGMLVMDEPTRSLAGYPVTEEEYADFASDCADAWQAINPNLAIITYGGGHPDSPRDLTYFMSNPMTQNNVYYTMTCYYDYSEGSEYRAGNRDTTGLYNWLDNKYGPLKSQMIPSVGLEATGTLWREFMEDVYDYNRANTAGIMQWACAKRTNWNLIGQDHMSWSEIGQFWDYAS